MPSVPTTRSACCDVPSSNQSVSAPSSAAAETVVSISGTSERRSVSGTHGDAAWLGTRRGAPRHAILLYYLYYFAILIHVIHVHALVRHARRVMACAGWHETGVGFEDRQSYGPIQEEGV